MTVRVADIAFVRFEAPDLDVMESFLTEFGLQRSGRDDETLYMRGTDDEGFVHVTHLGDTPRFVGFAFVVENLTDLEELARRDGFSPVHDLAGPGGGKVVQTIDPDGFRIEVVAARKDPSDNSQRPRHRHAMTPAPLSGQVHRFVSAPDPPT